MWKYALRLLLSAVALMPCLVVGAPGLSAQETVSSEAALRKRVSDFYVRMRARKAAEAEQFVTPDSLENFRVMPLGDFLGAEIDSIKFSPDKKSAAVMINLVVSAATLPVPFQLPRRTDWRLESDGWRIVIPQQTIESSGAGVMFPGNSRGNVEPPKFDLNFSNPILSLPQMKQGTKASAKFAYVNSTNHPVSIVEVKSDCKCIVWKSGKKTIAPGESGELVMEFDSSEYQYDYRQTIAVITSPNEQRVNLFLSVNIVPKY